MEGLPAVGALPSASWVFGSLHGVVLGWPGAVAGQLYPAFLKIVLPPKRGRWVPVRVGCIIGLSTVRTQCEVWSEDEGSHNVCAVPDCARTPP